MMTGCRGLPAFAANANPLARLVRPRDPGESDRLFTRTVMRVKVTGLSGHSNRRLAWPVRGAANQPARVAVVGGPRA